MAYGRQRRNGRFLAGRGALLVGIVALHGVAIVAFSQMNVRRAAEQPAEAVEVVFLDQTVSEAPPQHEVKLADVRPVDLVVPVVDLPVEAPAPAAITVTPPKVQVAAAAAPAPVSSDVPVVVDAIDYMRPPAPRYPPSAKSARVQGTVLLRVVIDRTGRPADVQIHRSSGSPQLDAAARESVFQALFRPHRENGEARIAQVIIPIEFSLQIRTAQRDVRSERGDAHGRDDRHLAQRVGHRRD